MNKTTLFLNTSDSNKTIVGIFIGLNKIYFEEKTDKNKSQNILILIEKALKERKITFADIKQIEVIVGPGSFTGIRVGISVANTLGWILNIPVNGKKIVIPKYQISKFD